MEHISVEPFVCVCACAYVCGHRIMRLNLSFRMHKNLSFSFPSLSSLKGTRMFPQYSAGWLDSVLFSLPPNNARNKTVHNASIVSAQCFFMLFILPKAHNCRLVLNALPCCGQACPNLFRSGCLHCLSSVCDNSLSMAVLSDRCGIVCRGTPMNLYWPINRWTACGLTRFSWKSLPS